MEDILKPNQSSGNETTMYEKYTGGINKNCGRVVTLKTYQ